MPNRAVLLLLAWGCIAAGQPAVVVDASAFVEHMPKGTIITSGPLRQLPGSWLFNNIGLVLRSQAYPSTKVAVPEAGLYHLFVRSHGNEASSFRVTVGAKQSSELFGNEPLRWKAGGTFDLKKGTLDVVLSRVVLGSAGGSTFNVLVLSRNPQFAEADLQKLELQPDVMLLKQYTIPARSSAVKFGDVDGDGRSDFFVLTSNYGGHMFNHDGKELWSYTNPEEGGRGRAGFEAPGLMWDFDRDGRAEAVHYQLQDGKEWLVMADGLTGKPRFKTEWPTPPMPHEYNNFRLAVAQLSGGYPSELLVFTDSGGTISITAFTKELKQLWQHVEMKKKDHLGHYVYAVDLNADGIDEVVASPIVLSAAGKVLWNRFDLFDDNHDHCDSFRFYDLDGDRKPEMLAPVSEVGVVVFRAATGEVIWRHPAEHTQQLEVGDFLRSVPGPHIAANARTYARNGEAGLAGQIHWFDARGSLLSKWPTNPINGNPDFVKGDWRGDGKQQLFWYRFCLGEDGRGSLCFRQDVYHMLDFMGSGADQVIARGAGSLLIYGFKNAKPKRSSRPPAYWKSVANHTHY